MSFCLHYNFISNTFLIINILNQQHVSKLKVNKPIKLVKLELKEYWLYSLQVSGKSTESILKTDQVTI